MTLRSQARRDEAVRRYEAGETATAIAASFGLSRERVFQYLRKAGVDMAARRQCRVQENAVRDAEIVRHWARGDKHSDIAEAFGLSAGHVSRIVSVREDKSVKRPLHDEAQYERMAALRASGLSYAKIGRAVGMQPMSVWQALRRTGRLVRVGVGNRVSSGGAA